MRIVCPSCEAEYDVPDSMLAGATRKVRCARCAREWAPFAAPPPPPEPEPEPTTHEPTPTPPSRPTVATKLVDHAPPIEPPKRTTTKVPGGPPGLALVIAWLITGALIIAGVFALWLKRPEIVHLWPPAARLYKLLGLE